jgi:hypothetical protein
MVKDIYFLNEYRHYNVRYRSALMNVCRRSGFNVYSLGMFEEPLRFLKAIFSDAIIISSNMRTNLVVMLINSSHGIIIVNGLTRWRRTKFLRFVMRVLIGRSSMSVCVQSYADYRYFRRFCSAELIWVPGSGGKARSVGNQARAVVVTRPRKFKLQEKWLRIFIEQCGIPVSIVGCEASDVALSGAKLFKTEAQGYVDQKYIFASGNTFLQLPGFGEGVPHTLVDAICSGMPIWISKGDFIRFGLYKLGMRITKASPFGRLEYSSDSENKVEQEAICAQYLRAALRFSDVNEAQI